MMRVIAALLALCVAAPVQAKTWEFSTGWIDGSYYTNDPDGPRTQFSDRIRFSFTVEADFQEGKYSFDTKLPTEPDESPAFLSYGIEGVPDNIANQLGYSGGYASVTVTAGTITDWLISFPDAGGDLWRVWITPQQTRISYYWEYDYFPSGDFIGEAYAAYADTGGYWTVVPLPASGLLLLTPLGLLALQRRKKRPAVRA